MCQDARFVKNTKKKFVCNKKRREGVYRRNNFIWPDKSEDREPEWSRTVEDLYMNGCCDSIQVNKVLRGSNQLL